MGITDGCYRRAVVCAADVMDTQCGGGCGEPMLMRSEMAVGTGVLPVSFKNAYPAFLRDVGGWGPAAPPAGSIVCYRMRLPTRYYSRTPLAPQASPVVWAS